MLERDEGSVYWHLVSPHGHGDIKTRIYQDNEFEGGTQWSLFLWKFNFWTIANVFALCKWDKNFMVKRDAPKGCPSRSRSLSGTLPSRRSQCYSPSLSILCAFSWDLWRITIYIYIHDMLMTMPPNTFDNLTKWYFAASASKKIIVNQAFFFPDPPNPATFWCNEFCHSEAPWNVVRLPADWVCTTKGSFLL